MVPYRADIGNERFNYKHSQCRNIIERCIGLLKSRFRCLLKARELHYTPEKVCQIINVCVMLHNMCLKYNVPFDDNLTFDDPDEGTMPNIRLNQQENITIQTEAEKIHDLIKQSL